jgi:hypothetical protein
MPGERKGKKKKERKKGRDGLRRRSSSSPRGPLVVWAMERHLWVLFVTGATCVLGQSRRGAPSRDRSGRGQIADGDAGRTWIR